MRQPFSVAEVSVAKVPVAKVYVAKQPSVPFTSLNCKTEGIYFLRRYSLRNCLSCDSTAMVTCSFHLYLLGTCYGSKQRVMMFFVKFKQIGIVGFSG